MKSFTERAFNFLDGKTIVHNGIEGTLKYRVTRNRNHPGREVHTLHHTATEVGKNTEQYRAIRKYLGDDWSSDLTDSEVWFDWLPEGL